MAEPPSGEKTEAPTTKRLRDAAQRGDTPDLKDLGVALVVGAGALWTALLGGALVDAAAEGLRRALTFGLADVTAFAPARAASRLVLDVAAPLTGLFACCAAGAFAAWAVAGARFSPQKLAPKFERINPLAGLARMFGRQSLAEVAKAVVKLLACSAAAALALSLVLRDMLALGAADPLAAAALAGALLPRLLLMLAAALVVVAVVSAPLAYLQWYQRLKMTKQEVRDEAKSEEGSPEVKAAQRRRQREAARAGLTAAMATADVVVTNPTHFAVALRYRRAQDRAPVVVARGKGELANMIRAAARERGVTTLEYPEFARALYFTSRKDGEIAPELYAAAAAVLAFVFNLTKPGPRRAAPVVEVPEPMRFDEDGRRARPSR